MGNGLKKIIEENGRGVLSLPDQLAKVMAQKGCKEKDILSVCMILKCCPSVASVLIQGNASEAEVNALVRSAVLQTGLTVGAVRNTLGMLMRACGFQVTWAPHFISKEQWVDRKVMPMTIGEDETLAEVQARIGEDQGRVDALSDLNTLSEQGNARASYALGKFYKVMDDRYNTQLGKQYFQKAANQGYGPANGALADYLVRGERKRMSQVAACFENPTALAGGDGREWSGLSTKVLRYREENAKRLWSTILVQIVMFVLTVVILTFEAADVGGWGLFTLAVQLGCLGWSLFSRMFKPYNSCRIPYYGMMLSWLCIVLTMF